MKSAELLKTINEINKLFIEHSYGTDTIYQKQKFEKNILNDELFNNTIHLLNTKNKQCFENCDKCILVSFSFNFCKKVMDFNGFSSSDEKCLDEIILNERKYLSELFKKYREIFGKK